MVPEEEVRCFLHLNTIWYTFKFFFQPKVENCHGCPLPLLSTNYNRNSKHWKE